MLESYKNDYNFNENYMRVRYKVYKFVLTKPHITTSSNLLHLMRNILYV
jgi:hypothetical protein